MLRLLQREENNLSAMELYSDEADILFNEAKFLEAHFSARYHHSFETDVLFTGRSLHMILSVLLSKHT